ncbi:MAG: hypothetical protein ABIQ59_17830 [Nocardioidaceae bacterium]
MYETDDTTTPFVSANSQAAARLLEMAANNADQLVAEAKAEAAALLNAASSDADQVTSSAVAESDQLLAAARDEAQQISDEAQQARTEQAADLERARAASLADLADEKAHLAAAVDRLREVERDHVARMRTYLAEELAHLDQLAPVPDVAAVADTAA